MKNKNLMFIADIFPETSGQAVISKMVYNILKNEMNILLVPLIYKNNNIKGSFFFRVSFLFRLAGKLFSFTLSKSNKKIIYFTPSRGGLSIYRDFILIILLRIIKLNNNVKIFSHLHGSDMKKSTDNFFIKNFFLTSYIKLNIFLIILSENHKKFAFGIEYKNYKIIPNFIPSSNVFQYIKPIQNRFLQHKARYTKYVLLHFSGVLKNKGLDFAIKFTMALNNHKFFFENKIIFSIKIVGWNRSDVIKLHPEISPFLISLEKSNLIKFYGPVYKKNELNLILAKIHFNILFSKSEAQPLSLLEAASYGCISVVNNTDFINDMFLTIDGFCIDRNNFDDALKIFEKYFNNIDRNFFSYEKCDIRNKKINNYFSFNKFQDLIKTNLT